MDNLVVMPKYDSYKDSGVDWLGPIPAKWSIVPAKRRHRVIKSINKQNQCENVLSLTLRGVVNNNPESPEGLIPSDYASYQIFEKDDLVFKLIDLENIKTSRVGIVHELGIMSPAYIRMRVNSSHYPKYVYYYFYNLYLNSVYNNLGAGVRSTLGPSDLLEIKVIEPSFDEQVAIANFLDRKLLQIDEAIAIKEQQITLLKERKQIIIQQAVTQGLNPNVPMKDSGVEWFASVPESWEITKLGFISKVGNGCTPSRSNKSYWEDGTVPWLNSSKVNDGLITEAEQFVSTKAIRECHLPIVESGSLVIAITGEGKTRGMAALCKINTTINQHLAYITVNAEKMDALFVLTFLRGMYSQIRSDSSGLGSTKGAITCGDLKKYPIPVPPLDEQASIVAYVENESAKLDLAISLFMQQIEKLKDYKTTLINSAVTGKIKVA